MVTGIPHSLFKAGIRGDHDRITNGLPDPFRLQSPISYEVSILRNLLLILLVVVAIGCDDMQKPVMNVISKPVATEESATPEKPQPLTITYDNAFDLTPGIYRFRPNSYSESGEFITNVYWGNIIYGEEIGESPADAPKVSVAIRLNPQPYTKMLNGKLAINFARFADGTVVVDELLVEIGEKILEETEQGGERGNRYEYTVLVYEGVALENLTDPDRAFEYE